MLDINYSERSMQGNVFAEIENLTYLNDDTCWIYAIGFNDALNILKNTEFSREEVKGYAFTKLATNMVCAGYSAGIKAVAQAVNHYLDGLLEKVNYLFYYTLDKMPLT